MRLTAPILALALSLGNAPPCEREARARLDHCLAVCASGVAQSIFCPLGCYARERAALFACQVAPTWASNSR